MSTFFYVIYEFSLNEVLFHLQGREVHLAAVSSKMRWLESDFLFQVFHRDLIDETLQY